MPSGPTRSWWGWGWEESALADTERAELGSAVAALLGLESLQDHAPPEIGSLTLRQPRVKAPRSLERICSSDPPERVAHAHGKAFRDIARNLLGQIDNPPDVVARPGTEAEVVELLDWCTDAGVAAIPLEAGRQWSVASRRAWATSTPARYPSISPPWTASWRSTRSASPRGSRAAGWARQSRSSSSRTA